MKIKSISIFILSIPFFCFSQIKDTSEFKISGNLLKLKYNYSYTDSVMMDSLSVVDRLQSISDEFNQTQSEIQNMQNKRQKKKREHNRLLIEAKKKWAINKTAL